jgi:SAM-dependent methyltransferase
MPTNWSEIVEHYESCLAKHGDNHLGVDWPNEEDARTRYQVMYGVAKDYPASFLDYGCGVGGFLYEFGRSFHSWPSHNDYFGYDKSAKMIEWCRKKHPDFQFSDVNYPKSDYVIMNGVFTEKRGITFGQMWGMVQAELLEVWAKTRKGLAFNVMAYHVDYEKDHLFHLPMDLMANFVAKNMSRKFVIRNEYLPY